MLPQIALYILLFYNEKVYAGNFITTMDVKNEEKHLRRNLSFKGSNQYNYLQLFLFPAFRANVCYYERWSYSRLLEDLPNHLKKDKVLLKFLFYSSFSFILYQSSILKIISVICTESPTSTKNKTNL